ncbi:glycosidase [Roseomonas sp. M0104]|uniref:Glycosidase n=1 Tax=Teichococcus coralli TaxID=2545983 RepID=A0A845BE66_9PROT|nr:glycosyl hydrolase [Pseudoroseomonas coralli]MXP63637.1 glycosidase [Pseudoroseomonas coralli]
MAEVGVYVGNNWNDLERFENWLGRPADNVHTVIGYQSWSDFLYGASWGSSNAWSDGQHDLAWSVPLIVKGATLAEAAAGAYNGYYRQAAEAIESSGLPGEPINIRPGWEFNGGWFPWSAIGHQQEYIGAFRQFVDTFRSVSDRFVFEWNVNEAWAGSMDPASAYPGDNYVDIVGMDAYWKTEFFGNDPYHAWDLVLNEQYGLQWHLNFAAAHSKPMAYSEWGVMTDNAKPYVDAMKYWFDTHNVLWQSRWDSDDNYSGLLSDGTEPHTGQAYVDAFHNPNVQWKLDGLVYVAGYPDLLQWLGADASAGLAHFFHHGVMEGRAPVHFDALSYLARYPDLSAWLGTNTHAAAQHFIEHGYAEGRSDGVFYG